ncbi:hypothetical protein K435DRAFT_798376, partial [Dendrothele bispora CBS 962.96]
RLASSLARNQRPAHPEPKGYCDTESAIQAWQFHCTHVHKHSPSEIGPFINPFDTQITSQDPLVINDPLGTASEQVTYAQAVHSTENVGLGGSKRTTSHRPGKAANRVLPSVGRLKNPKNMAPSSSPSLSSTTSTSAPSAEYSTTQPSSSRQAAPVDNPATHAHLRQRLNVEGGSYSSSESEFDGQRLHTVATLSTLWSVAVTVVTSTLTRMKLSLPLVDFVFEG